MNPKQPNSSHSNNPIDISVEPCLSQDEIKNYQTKYTDHFNATINITDNDKLNVNYIKDNHRTEIVDLDDENFN